MHHQLTANKETCHWGFFDARRKRVYVVCGAGFIDIFDVKAGDYQRLARIPTVSGARTALFMPAFDILALGVRASGQEPASVWLYRALP